MRILNVKMMGSGKVKRHTRADSEYVVAASTHGLSRSCTCRQLLPRVHAIVASFLVLLTVS
jgi:hypothetical protein